MLEDGATVCSFCGADQTHPVEFVAPNLPQPPTIQSILHDWGLELVVLVVVVGLIVDIFWQNFREQSISPDLQAAGVAATSLRDLREVLSSYALYMKDVYPMNLDSLGDRTTLPIQFARSAGYELQYLPKLFSRDGAPRGFAILARSEKSDYLNLYIDESGVVRATQEDRAATVHDPPF
jgi:hypothetical protein